MTDGNDPNEKMENLFGEGEQTGGDQATGTAKLSAEEFDAQMKQKHSLKARQTKKAKSRDRSMKAKDRMLKGLSFEELGELDQDEKKEAVAERLEDMLGTIFEESSTEVSTFLTYGEAALAYVLKKTEKWLGETSAYSFTAYEAKKMKDPHFALRIVNRALNEIKKQRGREGHKEDKYLREVGRQRAKTQSIERDLQEWAEISERESLKKEELEKQLADVESDIEEAKANPEYAETGAMLEVKAQEFREKMANMDYRLRQADRFSNDLERNWGKIFEEMNKDGIRTAHSRRGEADLYVAEEALLDRQDEIRKYISMLGETEEKPAFTVSPKVWVGLGNRTREEEKAGTIRIQQYETPEGTEYVPETDAQLYAQNKTEKLGETIQLRSDAEAKTQADLGAVAKGALARIRANQQKAYKT